MNKLNLGAFAMALSCLALVSTKTTTAQPTNDDYALATPMVCGDQQIASTDGATESTTPENCIGIDPAADVWYMHVGTGECTTASLCAGTSYDANLSIYALDGSELTCVASNSDFCGTAPSVTYTAEDQTLYYIRVGGDNGEAGEFTLDLSCTAGPVNDQPCGAITLPIGLPKMISNLCATADASEPAPGAGTGSSSCTSEDGWCEADVAVQNSVWYKFTAPESGCVSLDLSSGANLQVAVYATVSCGAYDEFTLIKANDDDPSGQSAAYIDRVPCLTPGVEYYVQVDGFQGAAGTGAITLHDCGNNPLYIDVPEQCIKAYIGVEPAEEWNVLSAQPRGGFAPYSYEWEGPNIVEVMGAGMEFTAEDEGYYEYTCTMTDAEGCQTTGNFTVGVENVDASPAGDGSVAKVWRIDEETGEEEESTLDVDDNILTIMEDGNWDWGYNTLGACTVYVNRSNVLKLCQKTQNYAPNATTVGRPFPWIVICSPSAACYVDGNKSCDYVDDKMGDVYIEAEKNLFIVQAPGEPILFNRITLERNARMWHDELNTTTCATYTGCPDLSICRLDRGCYANFNFPWQTLELDFMVESYCGGGGQHQARMAGMPTFVGSGTTNVDPLRVWDPKADPTCGDCFDNSFKNGTQPLVIDLVTDGMASQETSIQIVDITTNTIIRDILVGGLNDHDTYQLMDCVPDNHCFEFRISDLGGDGICCANGNGSYTITLGSQVYKSPTLGKFGSYEVVEFGDCGSSGGKGKRSNESTIDMSAGTSITAFPNPFNSLANFTFTVEESTTATLQVFDMTGKLMATPFNGYVEAGQTYNGQFDGSNLAEGVYFYKFSTASGAVAQDRIVLIK